VVDQEEAVVEDPEVAAAVVEDSGEVVDVVEDGVSKRSYQPRREH